MLQMSQITKISNAFTKISGKYILSSLYWKTDENTLKLVLFLLPSKSPVSYLLRGRASRQDVEDRRLAIFWLFVKNVTFSWNYPKYNPRSIVKSFHQNATELLRAGACNWLSLLDSIQQAQPVCSSPVFPIMSMDQENIPCIRSPY